MELKKLTVSVKEGAIQSFSMNDNVEVCFGELKNTKGKVIAIDGQLITLMPKHEEIKDLLKLPANELRKCFKTGDHVKVLTDIRI